MDSNHALKLSLLSYEVASGNEILISSEFNANQMRVKSVFIYTNIFSLSQNKAVLAIWDWDFY